MVWDARLREIRVQLMGAVQLEILQSLIRMRFGWDVTFDTGRISYRETIAAPVEGVGHFEPLRHYAEVHLILAPLPQGSGLVFDTVCSEDVLDRNWQRLILTHLQEKQHLGVLTGSLSRTCASRWPPGAPSEAHGGRRLPAGDLPRRAARPDEGRASCSSRITPSA